MVVTETWPITMTELRYLNRQSIHHMVLQMYLLHEFLNICICFKALTKSGMALLLCNTLRVCA